MISIVFWKLPGDFHPEIHPLDAPNLVVIRERFVTLVRFILNFPVTLVNFQCYEHFIIFERVYSFFHDWHLIRFTLHILIISTVFEAE